MVSLLHTEGILDCSEAEVHKNFALVEKWREVEKVSKFTLV